MTVSISPCCANAPESRLSRWPLLLGAPLLAILLLWLGGAHANEGRIRSAEIVRGEGGSYVLNADIDVRLNSRLVGAIDHGVPLYFAVDVQVERPRRYWFDEAVLERSLEYRLSYHALTRSYRLSIGSIHQSFESLDSAVRTMQRVRNWQIARPGLIEEGRSHTAAVRFRLDTSQLPKPFQVTAIGSRDWNLATDWVRWTFLPGAAGQR